MEKILVLVDTGCEEACVAEIGRWLKVKPKAHQNVIELDGTLEDAALLGYRLQTARRVLIQVTEPLDDLEEIESRTPHVPKLPEGVTFKAEGEVIGEQMMTQELVEAVGGWLHTKLELPVKLNKPDLVFYTIATTQRIYVGLDIVGRTLSKRDWRIMLSRRSLKSTIAAATVVYAGATEKDVILDPLADDGTIVIEAALYLTKTSPRHFERGFTFEKLTKFEKKESRKEIHKITAFAANHQEMKAVRTNAKLAGVEKEILATKVTIDWVDAKIEERSVDRIITAPIPSGKSMAPQQVAKINEQLFYQAEYIVKKSVTCITEKPDELLPAAEKYKFKVTDKREVYMGKRLMTIITFAK